MIRVLQVVGGMNQGGAENFIMNLYRNIDRTKIQFDFLVNRPGVFDKEIKQLGGNVYYINALQNSGQIKYTMELREFLRNHKYTIVHSHINKVSGLILECAKKEGIPVRIAHSHSSGGSKNIITSIYKSYLGKKIEKNSTLLLACSKEAALRMFGKCGSKAIIINNAVDINRFKYSINKRNEIRKRYKISQDTIVLGNIGRFTEAKNHDFLLDVFKSYKEQNDNTVLMLVGKGELRKKIENKAKLYNINDKVIYVGTTLEPEKYYSAFDCFVFPSIFEGLPLALIEAQISGLNCLASKNVIPAEAKISDRLVFISLHEKPETWTSYISKSKNRTNLNIGSEYDIKKIAKKLEMLYIESIKGIKNGQ